MENSDLNLDLGQPIENISSCWPKATHNEHSGLNLLGITRAHAVE